MKVAGRSRNGLPILLALLVSILAPAAHGQALPDSTGTGDWVLQPPNPCVADEVTLLVRGFHSTPCDSFIRAWRSEDRVVMVRTLVREGFACLVPPVPYAVPIGFGTLPAGPHGITLRHRRLLLHGDGTLDSTTVDEQMTFQVAPTCAPPSPIPADQLPFVTQVFTDPVHPCPERPTSIELRGVFPNGCGRLVSAGNDNGRLSVVLAPYPQVPTACPAVLEPWQATLGLGFLQTGSHQVNIDLTVRGNHLVWPPILDQRYVGRFGFGVASPCDSLPPGGLLPYVDFIHIGPARPDSSGPICPAESIQVAIGGRFPNDCFRLERVDLIDYWIGPGPGVVPAVVRLVVDDGGCLGRPCGPGPVPWSTSVTLPPRPSGGYGLLVQLAQVSCSDSILPGDLYSTRVPFQVVPADSCNPIPWNCLSAHWERDGDEQACNTFVSQQRPAQLTLDVTTGVALSGFQGTLRFREPGLRITALETAGSALGMRLSWTATQDGARFVMFADQGAPIPATGATPRPVLRVRVEPAPIRASEVAWPAVFHLAAEELLGSDIDAQAVLDCSSILGAMVLPPTALICIERPCDFNADGAADVRDLVLMVRCANGSGACPSDVAALFDCDGDGRFALGDVLCCAVHVLRGPLCPDCPVDSMRVSNGRAELAPPSAFEGGVRVPVRITHPGELGAARLALRFPTERYRLSSVELVEGSHWLELHEATETGTTLGLIRLRPQIEAVVSPPLDAILQLELLPGQQPGGEIRLDSADFSANDGVRLSLERGEVVQALGATLHLALSPARPNPFTGQTRFAVTLDGDAQLEVGIYDLGGRRVARLYRGAKGPGTHTFTWNGRAADGGAAAEGIYFYRVTGAGRSASAKVALVRVR